MGTTADKLNYLAETKSNIKQSLVDLGINVQDETTFREYASLIGGIGGKKVVDVSVDLSANTYTLRFRDGSSLSGSAEFDENGLPISLIDDIGNQVNFESGNPVTAVDDKGNVVNIVMGGE